MGHLIVYSGAAIVFLVAGFICNLLVHPLKNIPGPWHARLTSLGLMIAAIRGRQLQWTEKLHQRYGPVVRIRPNEVSFSTYRDFKDIHRMGAGLIKSEYYDKQDVSFGQHPSVFSLRDPKVHSARRKLFARVMSQRYLYDNWQDKMDSYVHSMVAKLKAEALDKGEADVAKWFRLLAGDVSSHLMFGESFGNVEKGELVPYMRAIEQLPTMSFLSWTLPIWMLPFLQYLPLLPESWRQMYDANQLVFDYGALAVKNSRANTAEDKKNVFATAIAESEKEDGKLSDEEIVSEAGAFMRAGTDTTAGTLLFAVWAIMQRPGIQRQLEEEVAAVDGIDDAELEKFPLLNACIDETMRMYGVASGTLPRQVPPGGATIHDTFIPGGTVVGAPAYVFQRDPAAFSNPEVWTPQNFHPSNPQYDRNRDLLSPFGAGSRVCIGKHLAAMEMRKALALFFRECRGARLARGLERERIAFWTMDFFLTAERTEVFVTVPGQG